MLTFDYLDDAPEIFDGLSRLRGLRSTPSELVFLHFPRITETDPPSKRFGETLHGIVAVRAFGAEYVLVFST